MITILIGLGYSILGFLLFVILLSTIVIVKQKTAVVIERFGKFKSVRTSGLSFKLPWPIDTVSAIINLQINQLKNNVTVKSKDNAFLTIPVNVQYKVIESMVKEAYYELDDPEGSINSYILNMVRSQSAKLTMEELYASKDSFEGEVKESLNEKFKPFGYQIVDLLIDDPQPSKEVEESFNNVLVAKRKKDAAKNEAEALKIKMIGEAQAEKESLVLKGEAFTAYRAKIAEGNIEAMSIMLGKAKTIKNENGELTFQKIPESEQVKVNLTEKDILDFFAGVDQREAVRSVGKNKGSVVISTGTSSNNDIEKIVSLIKSLEVGSEK